ncbi:hypothetical protein SEA_PIPERIS_92 [Microbacterium phage Piperis]|uniref:Uncharacterized protein n=1 Tax=Microbacterium phage Piperis TaxID=2584496 RepID=A0A4Y5P021_9CAUD|nr:hypothetical protein SEA_PIPERIS_92 [Microbacterium phage Piperis]
MSNVTRKQVREFLETMDNLAEPDAAARLQQAQMLSACAVPDDLVRIIAKIGAQGRVMADDLNVIAGMGYTLPRRSEVIQQNRAEVVDSLIRGMPGLVPSGETVFRISIQSLQWALGRAYDFGTRT